MRTRSVSGTEITTGSDNVFDDLGLPDGATLKMESVVLIEQSRAEARAALAADRSEADTKILRMHENALAALRDPAVSEAMRLEALLTTQDWEDRGTVSEDHIRTWKAALAMEDEDAATVILADSEEAHALRRTTPFSREALTYQKRG